MKPVLAPTTDVNSETGVLLTWHVGDRTQVSAGDMLAEIETSKAIIDVEAPESGIILHGAHEGTEVRLSEPVARIFPDAAGLAAYASELERRRSEQAESGPRASAPARRRAEELGVDLSTLASDALITVGMVEAAAAAASATVTAELPDPLPGVVGMPRIALIGAGLGATQVIDILQAAESGTAVAIADDDPTRWADEVMGVPVVGGFERLVALFEDGAYDAAIIAVGTSVDARARLREACAERGIPLANAIDPSVRIAAEVQMGTGNIICAHCHFGVGTTVGDNNFFSAYNSFDHHSRIGSDNATGPSCTTSGLVVIGDRIRFGMGIHVEPYVELGDDVVIASGSVIVASVPAAHAVKRRVVTTAVVPRR
jgi:acetyltransferase-like isoleucine patch superfamily enzyme